MKYNRILNKGLYSSLSSTDIENGKLRITTDTRQLFLDDNDTRIEITDFNKEYTEEEVLNILAPLSKFYYTKDTHRLMYYNDGIWVYFINNDDVNFISDVELKDASDDIKSANNFIGETSVSGSSGGAMMEDISLSKTLSIGDIVYMSSGSFVVYGDNVFTGKIGYYKIKSVVTDASNKYYLLASTSQMYSEYLGESYKYNVTIKEKIIELENKMVELENNMMKIAEACFICMEEIKDIDVTDIEKLKKYNVVCVIDSNGSQKYIDDSLESTGEFKGEHELFKIPTGSIVSAWNIVDSSEASCGYYMAIVDAIIPITWIWDYTQFAYDSNELEYFKYLGTSSIGLIIKK